MSKDVAALAEGRRIRLFLFLTVNHAKQELPSSLSGIPERDEGKAGMCQHQIRPSLSRYTG